MATRRWGAVLVVGALWLAACEPAEAPEEARPLDGGSSGPGERGSGGSEPVGEVAASPALVTVEFRTLGVPIEGGVGHIILLDARNEVAAHDASIVQSDEGVPGEGVLAAKLQAEVPGGEYLAATWIQGCVMGDCVEPDRTPDVDAAPYRDCEHSLVLQEGMKYEVHLLGGREGGCILQMRLLETE